MLRAPLPRTLVRRVQHRIAVLLGQVRGNSPLDDVHRLSYIRQGLEAEDRALALQPDHRGDDVQEHPAPSAGQHDDRSDRAEAAHRRSRHAARRVIDTQRPPGAERPQATEPDGCPFAGFSEPFDQATARLQPVRAGGDIRTRRRSKMSNLYTPIAQSARLQGVVILELLDEGGSVANARVLRSVPLLDAAAIEAVGQWRFTPTELDGRRVAVVMTVTVNFTLME